MGLEKKILKIGRKLAILGRNSAISEHFSKNSKKSFPHLIFDFWPLNDRQRVELLGYVKKFSGKTHLGIKSAPQSQTTLAVPPYEVIFFSKSKKFKILLY